MLSSDSICVICMETIDICDNILIDSLTTNNCSHTFHKKCFISYASFGGNINEICPTCRQPWIEKYVFVHYWEKSISEYKTFEIENFLKIKKELSKLPIELQNIIIKEEEPYCKYNYFVLLKNITIFDDVVMLKKVYDTFGVTMLSGHHTDMRLDKDYSVLSLSCKYCSYKCMKWLLENIEYEEYDISYSFLQAVISGYCDIVHLMFEKKKDVLNFEIIDSYENNLTHSVLISEKIYPKYIMNMFPKFDEKCLKVIIEYSHIKHMFYYVEKNCEYDKTLILLYTCVHWFDEEIIDFLLNKGADVNKRVKDGEHKDFLTVLGYTISIGSLKWIKYMFEHGGKVTEDDVCIACRTNLPEVFTLVAQKYRKQVNKKITKMTLRDIFYPECITSGFLKLVLRYNLFEFKDNLLYDIFNTCYSKYVLKTFIKELNIDFETIQTFITENEHNIIINYSTVSVLKDIFNDKTMRYKYLRKIKMNVIETSRFLSIPIDRNIITQIINSSSARYLKQEQIIDVLMTDMPLIDYVDEKGNTLLHIGLDEHMYELVIFLLENGICPNIENNDGETAMFKISEKVCLYHMLNHGGDFQAKTINKNVVSTLINNFADDLEILVDMIPKSVLKHEFIYKTAKCCNLTRLCLNNNVYELQKILETKVISIHNIEYNNRDLISIVCGSCNINTLTILLKYGMDIKKFDLERCLQVYYKYGTEDMDCEYLSLCLQELGEYGYNINDKMEIILNYCQKCFFLKNNFQAHGVLKLLNVFDFELDSEIIDTHLENALNENNYDLISCLCNIITINNIENVLSYKTIIQVNKTLETTQNVLFITCT